MQREREVPFMSGYCIKYRYMYGMKIMSKLRFHEHNKWVWWLEKCKTRTHTRSLENVWRKHWWRGHCEYSWNKWRKNRGRRSGGMGRQTTAERWKNEENERESLHVVELLAICPMCICYYYSLTLIQRRVFTFTYSRIYMYTCGASRNRFRFFICSPDAV